MARQRISGRAERFFAGRLSVARENQIARPRFLVSVVVSVRLSFCFALVRDTAEGYCRKRPWTQAIFAVMRCAAFWCKVPKMDF